MKKIYVAGPMTGYDELNYLAFATATALLREDGYEVVSPAELNLLDTPYADAMRNDLRQLIECDTIYLLPGWQHSKGASLEYEIAGVLGMTVLHDRHYLEYLGRLRAASGEGF